MTLLILASIGTSVFFGILVILFSIKEERARKDLLKREAAQKHRLYQISILKEVQDRIGYSLDIEKVIEVIMGSLRNLFPYSSTSSLIIKEGHLVFKTYVNESVSHTFIEQVKKSMLASLGALLGNVPTKTEEELFGVPLDDSNPLPLISFFHIPLFINSRVLGIINVSSTKLNLYGEDEMTILYQIVAEASNTLSRLEEMLENEKGKLEAIIRSLADGVFMVDKKSQVLIINDAAKRFLGIERENPTILDLLGLFPKTYDLIGKINEAIQNNKIIEEKELAIENKTFQVFITPVSIRTRNEKDLKEEPIGASIMLHDISLEKNLSQIKEDFTNMMVHELRAPLAVIKDSAELLLSEKPPLKKPQREQFLDVIYRQSKVLLDQIASILDAAKLESGRFALEKKSTDLEELIYERVKVFLPQVEKKEVFLSADIPQPLPLISIDKTRIIQVINNLLSNSVKFTPRGGKIKISAKIMNNPLGTVIKVSVADTGIGIPKERQGDIFLKFYQVKQNQNESSPSDSSGLGLYITKRIIEAHGGFVEVKSEENHGTTVSFTLPVQEKQIKPSDFPYRVMTSSN